jgi:phospholipid/cholesterol/gamma-HCH transport system substrate-binding protein
VKNTKLELTVGIFVLVGIAALTYLAVKLGKLEVVGSQQRHVEAVFDSVAGLKTGAPVEVAGVQVGQVKRIALDGEHALVTLSVKPDLKVYQDAIASIKTRGLIGDKYVALSPGGSDKELTAGGKIRDTESGVDLEAIIGEFIHGSTGSGANDEAKPAVKAKPEASGKPAK